jgi:histidyl-tRNA synthetase
MEEQNLFEENKQYTTKLLFTNFDEESQNYCLPLLKKLREAGVNAEIYPHKNKLAKQMAYANNKNIPYVILAGSDEISNQKLNLKDMISGEQKLLSFEEVLEIVSEP